MTPDPPYFCKSIAIQMRGVSWYKLAVYILLSSKRSGTLLLNHRYRNGRCIAILFKSVGVRGQFYSPDQSRPKHGMYFLHLVSRCGHHCVREADMATPLQMQQLVGCKIISLHWLCTTSRTIKRHYTRKGHVSESFFGAFHLCDFTQKILRKSFHDKRQTRQIYREEGLLHFWTWARVAFAHTFWFASRETQKSCFWKGYVSESFCGVPPLWLYSEDLEKVIPPTRQLPLASKL